MRLEVDAQRTKLDALRRDYNELDEQLARYVKREKTRERREMVRVDPATGAERPTPIDPGMGRAAPTMRGVHLRRFLRQQAEDRAAAEAAANGGD